VFQSAASFNQPLGSWDISNVNNNMTHMFNHATSFWQYLCNWYNLEYQQIPLLVACALKPSAAMNLFLTLTTTYHFLVQVTV
jgi:hypothetical protein